MRIVRALAIVATGGATDLARSAVDLRGVAAARDLERRGVVGAHGRRRGVGGGICDLHGDLGEGVSLGIERGLHWASSFRKIRPLG